MPLIAEALRALRVRSVTIDSDGVVCRADGVSDFDRLRAAVSRLGSRDAFLYAFDLLEIDGEDLRQSRRAMLRSLLKRTGTGIRLSDHLDGNGTLAFQHACFIEAAREPAKAALSRRRSLERRRLQDRTQCTKVRHWVPPEGGLTETEKIRFRPKRP